MVASVPNSAGQGKAGARRKESGRFLKKAAQKLFAWHGPWRGNGTG
jgi:hypothetical protein